MKRILACVLAAIIAVSCFSIVSFAQTKTLYQDGNFQFYLNEQGAFITKVTGTSNGKVDIPNTVSHDSDFAIGTITVSSVASKAITANGVNDDIEKDDNLKPDPFGTSTSFVVGIAPDALYDVEDDIVSVSVPRYLTQVVDPIATFNLANLESITVNSDNEAFASSGGTLYSADKKTLYYHPQQSADSSILSTVTKIEPYAFSYSSKITSVSIPAGVTKIPENCFENCTALKNLDLSSSQVSDIESYAFSYAGLESVDLGTAIKNVEAFAFFDCSALTNLVVNPAASDVRIGAGAFIGCPLSDFTVYRSVVSVDDHAFGYYYDDDYALQKYNDFTITSYKYDAQKTQTTPLYDYAQENDFTFIPIERYVHYTYPALVGYHSALYLYQNKEQKYVAVSDNGEFEIADVAAGKYSVYVLSKFGVLQSIGNLEVVAGTTQDTFGYNMGNTYSPKGNVNGNDVIGIDDIAAIIASGSFGKVNADYDIDLDGVVGISDISIIMGSKNYNKHAAQIIGDQDTPIIPI